MTSFIQLLTPAKTDCQPWMDDFSFPSNLMYCSFIILKIILHAMQILCEAASPDTTSLFLLFV